jgi:hypothetical protein
VVSGKVILEGEPLLEGATVTLLIPDRDEPFDLTEQEEALLLASIREADQGRTLQGSEILRDPGRSMGRRG